MADKVSKFIFPVKTGNTVTNKEFDVGGSGDTNTFVGTTAEWNALTTEQQNAYDCRVLTDDDLDTKNVIDNLNSESSTDALSAKQGKVLKDLVDTTQAQVSNSNDAFSPSRPYKVGELCIYNNVLYRCTTACSAGSWATNQSCFTVDTLTNVGNKINNDLIQRAIFRTYTVNTGLHTISNISQGDIFIFSRNGNGMIVIDPRGETSKIVPLTDITDVSVTGSVLSFRRTNQYSGEVICLTHNVVTVD